MNLNKINNRLDIIIEITRHLRLDNVKQYHKSLYSENVKMFKYVGWNGFFNLKTGLPTLFLKIRKNDNLLNVALEGLDWCNLAHQQKEFHVLSKKEDCYKTFHLKLGENVELIEYQGNGDVITINKTDKLIDMFLFIQNNHWYE